jgi:hypothetical protein
VKSKQRSIIIILNIIFAACCIVATILDNWSTIWEVVDYKIGT